MRKTLIQLTFLLVGGAIIFWKEWTVYGMGTKAIFPSWRSPEMITEAAMPTVILGLVLAAGIFFLFAERFSETVQQRVSKAR